MKSSIILPNITMIFSIISRSVLLRMRNVLDKFVRKIKTHIFSINFFPEDRAVYEKMWKNIVEPDSPHTTI